MSDSPRHVEWSIIEQRIRRGNPVSDPVYGQPKILVDVENNNTLVLKVFALSSEDEALPFFDRLECFRTGMGDASHIRLSCSILNCLPEFYTVICDIADLIQLNGIRADNAIRQVAQKVRRMLTQSECLTVEQQLGLWGELKTLKMLSVKYGWPVAIKSWSHSSQGNEEHDFSLSNSDVEVKTTLSERRVHTIGATQLLSKPGRILLVCSIQATSAGAASGSSLAELVERIRSEVPKAELDCFERALQHAGWNDAHASSCNRSWMFRSVPFLVNSVFLPRLEKCGPEKERIVDFHFKLSLDGLEDKSEEGWKWHE